MDEKEKLEFLHQLIWKCTKLNSWILDPELNVIYSNCTNEKLLENMFSLSGCKEYLREYIKTRKKPLFLSDSTGMAWVTVFEKKEESLYRIHMIGPAYTADVSIDSLKRKLNRLNIPESMKEEFTEIMENRPIMSNVSIFQYVQMLYTCITDEMMKISDLNYQMKHEVSANKRKHTSKSRMGVYATEQMLLNNIRKGNQDYKSAFDKAMMVSNGIRVQLGDSLRQAKDSSIVFAALSTRAAIEGGLSPESAYTLGDYYIQCLEECNTITETAAIINMMYEDFINRVHKCKKNPNISKTIQRCCDYIDSHIEEKISIEYLAKNVGYAEYYLSRKFKNEVGYSINDYIKNAKIEYAKLLLSTTQLSIQEVSDSLSFCSRSFFTNTFQKIVGQTPTEYRSGGEH